MENIILLYFLFMLETKVIFKLSMIQILYICNEKIIKCIFNRSGDGHFFREVVQGAGGGGGGSDFWSLSHA